MLASLIQNYNKNSRFKQVIGLFSANLIGLPVSVITSILITRYLGPQVYGDFRFINSIFSIAIIIFTFGFYQAGNRALVLNYDTQKAKEYYGAELVLTGVLFIVMSFCLVIYALYDPNMQEKQLSRYLLYIIPFGWVFLLLQYCEVLFQADNRIKLLAITRLYPKIGFLLSAALVYLFFSDADYNRIAVIWFFCLATQIIVYCLVLYKLNISFKNIKCRLSEIWSHNKSFGINVYIGSLFAVGLSALSEVLISYFGEDNSGVGFYSLALAFSMPLGFIPSTIATSHYKEFSNNKRIPRNLLLITIALSISAFLVILILVGPFVHFFYGEEFSSVIQLNFIVSIGTLAYGMADFFSRYLSANGKGKILRNSSFLVGGSLLLFNVILVPRFGAYGAAYTKIISGSVYLIIMIWHYQTSTREWKGYGNG